MNGDLCLVNLLFFDTKIGFYYKEASGLIPDCDFIRENIGCLSGFEFVGRTGYVIWIIEKKSKQNWNNFLHGVNKNEKWN